jgi:hypothetical protein
MTHINRRRGIAIAAAAALCALGSLVAQSALADEHDQGSRDRGRHDDYRQRDRNEHRDHGYRDRGYQRGRDYGYDHRYYYDRRYNDGGYAPPIVYAPPRPEPGVHILIPLHFR